MMKGGKYGTISVNYWNIFGCITEYSYRKFGIIYVRRRADGSKCS